MINILLKGRKEYTTLSYSIINKAIRSGSLNCIHCNVIYSNKRIDSWLEKKGGPMIYKQYEKPQHYHQ